MRSQKENPIINLSLQRLKIRYDSEEITESEFILLREKLLRVQK